MIKNKGFNECLSYFLSIVYIVFYLIIYLTNSDYIYIVNIVFIFINSAVIAFLLFFGGVFFFFTLLGLFMMDKKSKDYEKKIIAMKSAPIRFLVPLLYWLFPLLMYLYFVTRFYVLIPFVLYPLWFPFFYNFLSKKIKEYEMRINSPFVKSHDKKMF